MDEPEPIQPTTHLASKPFAYLLRQNNVYGNYIEYRLHSGVVASNVTSQKEGSLLDSQLGPFCVCVVSLHLLH